MSDQVYSKYGIGNLVLYAPIAPEGLKLEQVGTSIRLSWLDKSTYENGFIVERKTNEDDWKLLYFTGEKIDYFSDYGIFENNSKYYYRIRSYILLFNEKYLYSMPSEEKNITYYQNASSLETNIVEIDFNNETSLSFSIDDFIRIYVKNYDKTISYYWFCNDNIISISQHNYFADIIAHEIGFSKIVVKTSNSDAVAVVNLTITEENINENINYPSNIRARFLSNSSIEVFWNYENELDNISHFDVYRIERIDSETKYSLIDYDDLNKNRITSLPYDKETKIFKYDDYGLKNNTYYIYTIVAVSTNGTTSLYDGNIKYDYVGQKSYYILSTQNSSFSIDPSLSIVTPTQSLYLGILGYNKDSNYSWEIEENNSNSQIGVIGKDYIYYKISDKTISLDLIGATDGADTAKAKIIVTEVI